MFVIDGMRYQMCRLSERPLVNLSSATLSNLRAVLNALDDSQLNELGWHEDGACWNELELRVEAADSRAAQAERERDECRLTIEGLTSALDEQRRLLVDADRERDQLLEKLRAERTYLEKSVALHNVANDRVADLERERDELREKCERLEAELADLQGRYDVGLQTRHELREKVRALEAVAHRARDLKRYIDPRCRGDGTEDERGRGELNALGAIRCWFDEALRALDAAPQPEKAEPTITAPAASVVSGSKVEQPDDVDDLVHRVKLLPAGQRYRAMASIIESALMDFIDHEVKVILDAERLTIARAAHTAASAVSGSWASSAFEVFERELLESVDGHDR